MAQNWIKGAVGHPGASTAAAKAAGMTVHQWALKHRNDPGTVGKRARLALTFEGMAAKKKPGMSPLTRAATGGRYQ